jgi:hypothetical protein
MKTLTAMQAGMAGALVTLAMVSAAGCAPKVAGWKAATPSGTVEVTIAGVNWPADSQAIMADLVPRLLERNWTQLSADQYSVTFVLPRRRGKFDSPQAKLNFLKQEGATRVMVTLGGRSGAGRKCAGGPHCEGLQAALNEVKVSLEASRSHP